MQYPIFRCCIVNAGDIMRNEILKYENIRKLRLDHDLTQQEVARLLHVSQNTYSQYELGILNYPVDALVTLAQFYGVSVDYLLGLTDVKTPYSKK